MKIIQMIIKKVKKIFTKKQILHARIDLPWKKRTTFPFHHQNPTRKKASLIEEFFNDWNSKVQRRDYDLKEIEVFDDADGFGKKDFTPPYASKNTAINNVSDLFHFVKIHDVDFNPNQTSVICNEVG